MKDGLYFLRPPNYCENQYNMVAIQNKKPISAGIIHLGLHLNKARELLIKKSLGIHSRNTISNKKWNEIWRLF